MVEVALALIADYAAIDNAGKLNLIGGFSDVWAPALPAILGHATLVVMLEGPPIEGGKEQDIKITLIGPDHQDLVFEQEFRQAMPISNTGGVVKYNLLLHMQGLTLPYWGDYHFNITVDDEHKRAIPLRLAQLLAENA